MPSAIESARWTQRPGSAAAKPALNMARACSPREVVSTSGDPSCLEAAHKADYFAGNAESIGVGTDDDGFKGLVFR